MQAYTCTMISVLALNYVIVTCFKKTEQARDLHFSAFIINFDYIKRLKHAQQQIIIIIKKLKDLKNNTNAICAIVRLRMFN